MTAAVADQEAWDRMLASMRSFFQEVPGDSKGGYWVEAGGVLATITPAVPERSLPNSVVYDDEDALIEALPELAERYESAGVRAWTVWAPAHHERARRALAESGHALDAAPTAMIAGLGAVEAPREADPVPDADPQLGDLARVNDLAYGTGDVFQRLMGEGPADRVHTYVARETGAPVATVATHDLDGDCSVWWVATVPEARGRGLAAGLMRRALHAGRQRGCELSTLQATKRGAPVYERLGYRAFGTIEMWERRR